MPSSEVMKDFREGHLHSGKGGKIVKKKKQAKAILLSYLRKEGKIAPRSEISSKLTGRKKITTKS